MENFNSIETDNINAMGELFERRLTIANQYKKISDLPIETQFALSNQIKNITQVSKDNLDKLVFTLIVDLKLKEAIIKDLIKEGVF